MSDGFPELDARAHLRIAAVIRCLVSYGFGAALLPASIARREGPPVETRPLSPEIRLPAFLLWRAGRHRSAAADAFIDFVRDYD